MGHLVTSTNNGPDALSILAAKPPPDLVLLDIVMPGFDGIAVLNALGPTHPPVIVASGAEEGLDRIPLDKVRRVLKKPYEPDEMLEAVENVLASASPNTEKP